MAFSCDLFIAGSHQILASFVIAGLSVHRTDHGHLVELSGQGRQELTDLSTSDVCRNAACLS